MAFYVHNQEYIEFPPRLDSLEQIEDLVKVPVAFIFPISLSYGKVYRVDTYDDAKTRVIARAAGYEPEDDERFNLNSAVKACVSTFMKQLTENEIREYRLFVYGRNYGPVVPKEVVTHVRSTIPNTPGGLYIKRVNEDKVLEHVLYWMDMDQAFYRRLGD